MGWRDMVVLTIVFPVGEAVIQAFLSFMNTVIDLEDNHVDVIKWKHFRVTDHL